jgi:hypothetical protein
MAIDTNIQQHDPNGCLYIDKPKPAQWYESSHLIMTTKPSDPNNVYPGPNTTQLSVTLNTDCSLPGGDVSVIIEIYAGDPTMTMIPATPGVAGSGTLDTLQAPIPINPSTPFTASWDSSGLPHLSQPHHACILARVYPDTATPVSGDLTTYPPEDLHYAQHNCTVNTASGQGLIRIPINNGQIGRERRFVSMLINPNLHPSPETLALLLPSLQLVPGFKQIATAPPKNVGIDLGPFKGHEHESWLERLEEWIERHILELIHDLEGKAKSAGGHSTRAILPPNFIGKFDLFADLSGSNKGDAHILNVTQVDGSGQPYGGLTVAIVAT